MIRFLIALVFASSVLANAPAGAADQYNVVGEHLWTCMGCNPSRNDPEFILKNSGWSPGVQVGFLDAIRSKPQGDQVVLDMTRRHFGWVTQGGKNPGTSLRVDHNVRAQLPAGQRLQAADSWSVMGLTLLRFHRCGNYATPDEPIPPLPPNRPPYGNVPQVDCEHCCPTN